jgi:single-strand DNA-binding protein
MSVNKVILLGRVGRDPEGNDKVAKFSLATSERRKDSNGQPVENTEWHNIVCFGKTAENVLNYVRKGSEVYIEGRLQTDKYADKNGVEKYTTKIIANTIQFLSKPQARQEMTHQQALDIVTKVVPPPMPIPDDWRPTDIDDLPF